MGPTVEVYIHFFISICQTGQLGANIYFNESDNNYGAHTGAQLKCAERDEKAENGSNRLGPRGGSLDSCDACHRQRIAPLLGT